MGTAKPEEISKPAPLHKELDPFGSTIYRGPLFEAIFAATRGGFVVSLTNTSASEICFRFDEARLSSNYQETNMALRIFSPVDPLIRPNMTKEDLDKLRAGGPQKMEKACLIPGAKRRVPCYLAVKDFFPSGFMFNVAHPEHVPKLEPNGIGNWVKLYLPIDLAGRRENLVFTMTARQSHARASYH